jgi:hypothetical protein
MQLVPLHRGERAPADNLAAALGGDVGAMFKDSPTLGAIPAAAENVKKEVRAVPMVGLCNIYPADPWLGESAWFQPLNLSSEKVVSSLCCQI